MKPGINDVNVEIPVTFDVSGEVHTLTKKHITLGILMLIGVLILSLVVFFMNISITNGVFAVIIFLVGVTLIRYIWFTEGYFTKCYRKLLDNDFVYGQDLLWDIYDISDGYPAICRYRNGVNAIFVAFDKDIIIGKGLQNEYDHYEAISSAYQYIAQKNISFMHIDYMDVVGKDDRMNDVVNDLLKTTNEDLRQVLAAMFEYQQYRMNRVYASYDVYVFYYRGDDNVFLSELDNIIAKFMEANYIHYRFLDMNGIRELVKSIYNLPEFSVYKACDKVLCKSSIHKYVRVRKVSKNGQITVISKTNNEQAQEQYLREKEKQEHKAAKADKKPFDNRVINTDFTPTGNTTSGQAVNPFTNNGDKNIEVQGNDFIPVVSDSEFVPVINISDNEFVPINDNEDFRPIS